MATDEAPPTPTETLERLAKGIFAELHQAIILQEEGVLSGDIEAVHDMRVASRRLRVALSNFAVCCAPDENRRMRKLLGRLAEALGEVRDLDVMIAALKQYQTSLPPDRRRPVGAIIRRLQARRRQRRHQLETFLRGEDYTSFKREFPSLIVAERETEQQTEQQGDHEGAKGEEASADR
jgi:CHAD domain-containing protein